MQKDFDAWNKIKRKSMKRDIIIGGKILLITWYNYKSVDLN